VSGQEEGPVTGAAFYTVAWVFYMLLAVGGVIWLGLRRGQISWRLFVRPAGLPVDVGLGLAAAGVLLGVWFIAHRYWPSARRLEVDLRAILGPLTTEQAVALGLFSGIAEEVFFRGAMLAAWGWVPATLVFALLHAGGRGFSAAWILFAAIAGLLFAGLVIWRETLLAAVIGHALVNAVQLRRLGKQAVATGEDPGADC
jgi:membrane protease YdiL (CAAX protease family)